MKDAKTQIALKEVKEIDKASKAAFDSFDDFDDKTSPFDATPTIVTDETPEEAIPATVTKDSVVGSASSADEARKPFVPPPVTIPATRTQENIEKAKRAPIDKFINSVLKAAGKDKLPSIETLVGRHIGPKMKLGDIPIFTEKPNTDSPVLNKLFELMPKINSIHSNAPLEENQLKKVGITIIEAGLMHNPIQVDSITNSEDVSLQCSSGRHRAAFLALAYGKDVEIPVYTIEKTLNEARDGTIFANSSRITRTLEKAAHSVLRGVDGDDGAATKTKYENSAKNKGGMRSFCTYLATRKELEAITFDVSPVSRRKNNELTTYNNLEGFWSAAITWSPSFTFEQFQEEYTASIKFLNDLVVEMKKVKGFDPENHLANKPMIAIGKIYARFRDSIHHRADEVAKAVVELGECGSIKSEATFTTLLEKLK